MTSDKKINNIRAALYEDVVSGERTISLECIWRYHPRQHPFESRKDAIRYFLDDLKEEFIDAVEYDLVGRAR